ncbi:monovalent cation/H(+) antiporter subunit G [Pseudokineococcus marinus]|uniref:monovalent cation/H(+) antiporter subunit G n=1 Tax=Pseudokineococcus marinus TaxID=351215 RepID=UPI002ADDEA23|nr:monovalent cation/H(+) antiporter subunit G [Pseudokineococcus marinus]
MSGGAVGAVLDVLAGLCLGAGVLLALVAALGVLRLPDVLTRLHAAAKPQALGVVLVAVGVGLAVRTPTAIGVVALVVVFQLVTAPVAAHMVGRAAYRTGKVRRDLLLVDELSDLEGGEAPEGGLPDGCTVRDAEPAPGAPRSDHEEPRRA